MALTTYECGHNVTITTKIVAAPTTAGQCPKCVTAQASRRLANPKNKTWTSPGVRGGRKRYRALHVKTRGVATAKPVTPTSTQPEVH